MSKFFVDQCESFIKRDMAYNIENSIWPSDVEVADRLLRNSGEMEPVYVELATNFGQSEIDRFLEIVLSTAAHWNPESAREYRTQKSKYEGLNHEIGVLAAKLADLLEERRALSNESGFSSNHHYSITAVIDNAAAGNGHYRGFLREKLLNLSGQFDLKYWPRLSQFVSEISDDAFQAEVLAGDELTAAAISSQRSSVADFLRALFAAVEESGIRLGGRLKPDFRLSDNAFSIIANCALGLKPEELIDGPYVKSLRQRMRKAKTRERSNTYDPKL